MNHPRSYFHVFKGFLEKTDHLRVFNRLLKYVRPHTKPLLVIHLLGVVGLGAKSILPFLLKQLTESLQQGHYDTMIWVPPLAFVIVFVFAAVNAIRALVSTHISLHLNNQLQHQLYQRYLELDILYHFKSPVGEKMSRITFDVQYLVRGAMILASELLYFPLTFCVYLSIMVYLDWKLALCSLLIIPPVVALSSTIGKKLKGTSKGLQEQNVKVSQHLVDTLSGIIVVKAFGREGTEEHRFSNILNEFRQRGMRDAKWQAVLNPCVKITNAFFFCIIGWFALYRLTVARDLEVSTFIGFASVLVLFQGTLQQIGAAFEKLSRAAVSLDRVDEIFSRSPQQPLQGQTRIKTFKQQIEIKSLEFTYAENPVLSGLNLKISQGQLTVFSGLSGAGKTTFIRILVGLLYPRKGNIYIDNVDIQSLEPVSSRELFSFVPQTTTLFNQTVRENISYGRPEATEAEIIEAARQACAHEFIKNLPNGYETHVGDMGEHLSAGQRQRITIARSLLRPAPIIVFDECLSNLDYITEQRIYSNLWNLRGEKTIILVTHRLSAVRSADCIYHLADGRIAETGTHEELMALDGAYKHLYLMQEHFHTLTANQPT